MVNFKHIYCDGKNNKNVLVPCVVADVWMEQMAEQVIMVELMRGEV